MLPKRSSLTRRVAVAVGALSLLTAACGQSAPVGAGAAADEAPADMPVESSVSPSEDTTLESATTPPEPPAVPTSRPAGTATQEEVAPPQSATARFVTENRWTSFATVGGVVLHHPSTRVERVAFHESNHDGARQLEVVDGAVEPITLESRERDTGSRTAADVVVDPEVEIRAPVTGTVLRSGTYVLYCDYHDDFAVIEPDDHPGWEVKVLHIDGVRVQQGDRVEAGATVLAAGPTPLPFDSQVDDHTAEPSWPHVHIEVVDPSIPDRPSDGSNC